MTNFYLKSAVVAASILAPLPALASSATGVMPVSATTLNACAVVAQPLVFGTLNQIGGIATDSQTTVVVTCTPGITYDVGMDMGTHQTGGTRYLQSASTSSVVPYSLYTNSTHTTAWGNTVGTDTVSGTAGLLPTTLTVYGRVPASAPLVAAGLYTDVVTVTVTF